MRTIGEVSELAGVTVRALHHYDEIGLLSPRARSDGGYRLYSYDDLARLQEILVWRALGFTLGEIQQWRTIREESDAIVREFDELLESGEPADGEGARSVAERHRRQITRWFYECTPEIHRGLGEMYVADERFARTYERVAPGLAAYVRDAIAAAADAGAGAAADARGR